MREEDEEVEGMRGDLPLSGVLAISDPLRLLVNKSICVVKSNIS